MSAPVEPLSGHCHCGAIRYRVTAAPTFCFLCHCSDCSRLNGGLRLAGATVDAASFTMEGQPSTYRYQGGKGAVEVQFCGTCGTPVCARPETYPGALVVRANSFDDPSSFQPHKSIFTDHACAWETHVGG